MKISAITNLNQQVFNASEVKENKQSKIMKVKDFGDKTVLITSGLAALGLAAAVTVDVVKNRKIKTLTQALDASSKNSQDNLKNVIKNLSTNEKIIPFQIKNIKETELYEKFNSSGKNFVDFLHDSFDNAGKVKEFLFAITSDDELSQRFVKEVTANPRESLHITKLLRDRIGGPKNLTEWLQEDGGYYSAYKKYASNIYENAKNYDDLLRISPNWHIFALNEHWKGRNIQFGEIPDDFRFIQDNIKGFADWLAYMPLERGKATSLEYSGQNFIVEPLAFGCSSKMPLRIQFKDWNHNLISKPYVVKLQSAGFRHSDNINAKIAEAYRSDSVFVDAQIDRYLNLNNCKNANKLYFYDYDAEMAIYQMEDGLAPDFMHGGIRFVNNKLRDLNDLGIYYNDASPSNFIEKDGKLIVIDIGESSFIDPLRPGIPNLHFELPNWSGRSLPDLRRLQL